MIENYVNSREQHVTHNVNTVQFKLEYLELKLTDCKNII